ESAVECQGFIVADHRVVIDGDVAVAGVEPAAERIAPVAAGAAAGEPVAALGGERGVTLDLGTAVDGHVAGADVDATDEGIPAAAAVAAAGPEEVRPGPPTGTEPGHRQVLVDLGPAD